MKKIKISGRTGFTLIELLVVVLIIGILSAVALPQYNRAVLKSRATQGFITLSALDKAQQEYKLATGEYTNDLDNLSIQFDDDSLLCAHATDTSYCQLNISSALMMEVRLGYPQGNERRWACMALENDNVANAVCKSFGGSFMYKNYGSNYYTMP
ncbi:type IV pilin protein [Candidatus Avelusimicrobium sp.]